MVETPARAAPELTVGMLAQRLDGNDEAIRLLQSNADKQPTALNVELQVQALKELMETKIQALRELMEAKFDGNKVALDAALKTQKEGSDKIESSFTKQFDNVQVTIGVLTKTTDDKITDLKDRFNTTSGRSKGLGDGWGYLLGGLGAIAIIAGLILQLRGGV